MQQRFKLPRSSNIEPPGKVVSCDSKTAPDGSMIMTVTYDEGTVLAMTTRPDGSIEIDCNKYFAAVDERDGRFIFRIVDSPPTKA